MTPPTVPPGSGVQFVCRSCGTDAIARWWACRGCGELEDPALDSERRLGLITAASAGAIATIGRAAAVAMRSGFDRARLDLISDRPWPADAANALAQVRGIAVVRGRGETAVDVDPRDDADFEAFVCLLPYAVSAEAYAGDRLVLSMSDTGPGVWFATDRRERAALARALDSAGLVLDEVLMRRDSRGSASASIHY